MEEKKKIEFWKDGGYNARGGYFIKNNLKEFFGKLIDSGLEPVGIIVYLEDSLIEVIVKE